MACTPTNVIHWLAQQPAVLVPTPQPSNAPGCGISATPRKRRLSSPPRCSVSGVLSLNHTPCRQPGMAAGPTTTMPPRGNSGCLTRCKAVILYRSTCCSAGVYPKNPNLNPKPYIHTSGPQQPGPCQPPATAQSTACPPPRTCWGAGSRWKASRSCRGSPGGPRRTAGWRAAAGAVLQAWKLPEQGQPTSSCVGSEVSFAWPCKAMKGSPPCTLQSARSASYGGLKPQPHGTTLRTLCPRVLALVKTPQSSKP